jgi:hypothetical protein
VRAARLTSRTIACRALAALRGQRRAAVPDAGDRDTDVLDQSSWLRPPRLKEGPATDDEASPQARRNQMSPNRLKVNEMCGSIHGRHDRFP